MFHSKSVLASAPAAMALALMAGTADAASIKITAVAAAPPTVANVKATKETFIPYVNEQLAKSCKDFKIEWKEAYASSLATFNEVFEAVEEGIGQLGMILKTFEESKLPLEQVAYMVPFGGQTPPQMVEIDTSMRKKIPALNGAYAKHNQVFLRSGASPGMDLFTTFPVKSVDDVKGKKIGASGAMGFYLRNTGAVVVNSSMLDSDTSIKNGVYDGYPISVGLAGPYRTYQAAKYRAVINFGTTPTSGLSVNAETWKQLPDFAKKIFEDGAVKWSEAIEKIDAEREVQFIATMKKAGVVMTPIPPAERRKWAMTMPNIAQEWAESQEQKGLPGKLVLKTLMDELRGRKVEIARNWDRE